MPKELVGDWPSPPNPTQAHVVEQARYCIRHSGGAEVSLTEISRSAHHSPSTLIYQFGSYASLKDSIFVDIGLELADRVQSVMATATSKPIETVASALVEWTNDEPQAADFMVRQTPTDLRSAVSRRSSESLVALAGVLVPSLGAEPEAIDKAVPVLHQALNIAIRFIQANPDKAMVSTFLDDVVRSADTAAGLLQTH